MNTPKLTEKFLVTAILVATLTTAAQGATYTWKDIAGTVTSANWADAHWNDGTTDDQSWQDNNSAAFESTDATQRTINLPGIATVAGGIQINSGSWMFSNTGGAGNTANALKGTGGITIASGATLSLGSGTAVVKPTAPQFAGDIVVNGTLDLTGAAQTLANITGTGGGTVNIATRALTLNAPNGTYTGAITATTGKLTISGAGTYTVDGNITGSGGLVVTTTQVTFTGSVGTGDITNNGTITFNNAGTVTAGGAITGNGKVIKEGTGTLTLSAVSPYLYTGGTAVNEGTLVLGGAPLQGPGNVTVGGVSGKTATLTGATQLRGKTVNVKSGGTFDGRLSVASSTVIIENGGFITPFAETAEITGRLTIVGGGSIQLQSGATFVFNINETGNSMIKGNSTGDGSDGTLIINPGAILNITAGGDISGQLGNTFSIANDDITVTGWDNFTINNTTGYDLVNLGAGQFQLIPEPSTYALVAGLGALGAALVARRRKRA